MKSDFLKNNYMPEQKLNICGTCGYLDRKNMKCACLFQLGNTNTTLYGTQVEEHTGCVNHFPAVFYSFDWKTNEVTEHRMRERTV